MTSNIHRASLRASVEGFSYISTAVRTWLKRRRDRRVIESLSQEQLKDIGYYRTPSGEIERGGW